MRIKIKQIRKVCEGYEPDDTLINKEFEVEQEYKNGVDVQTDDRGIIFFYNDEFEVI